MYKFHEFLNIQKNIQNKGGGCLRNHRNFNLTQIRMTNIPLSNHEMFERLKISAMLVMTMIFHGPKNCVNEVASLNQTINHRDHSRE